MEGLGYNISVLGLFGNNSTESFHSLAKTSPCNCTIKKSKVLCVLT